MAQFVSVEQGGGLLSCDNATLSEKIFNSNPKGAPGPGEFSTVGTPAECKKEAEGLKEYGVTLSDKHFEGYYYQPELGDGISNDAAVKQPWEVPMLQQFGPSKAIKCETIEGWNNEDFLFEIREGIAYCTLNRPAANNAMNDTISAGLHDSARILRNRPDIRIAVLTGNGRMFCAGGDPKALQQQPKQEEDGEATGPPVGKEILKSVTDYTQQFEAPAVDVFARDLYDWFSLPQFTICCMNGSAMGGGVGLVSVCNLCVAVKTAHATLSEVKLGVIPAVISPYIISTIGVSNAKRLFCTAENTNMQTALEFGLVQRLVDDISGFPQVIKEVATKLQACAPQAVAAGKMTILNTLHRPMSESMVQYTAKEYARVRKAQECEEGMKALGSKKKPSWVETKINFKEA
mmetsp:Transcript_119721/g.255462  ORF Transcript_119721/g.255462 Transcript_119721/m.255462 type:complete len:404 (+) Transcript_119721:58-1269(+)